MTGRQTPLSEVEAKGSVASVGWTVPAQAPFRIPRVFSLSARPMHMAREACSLVALKAQGRGRLRVWVPACKTGSTAYTISMLLLEAALPLEPVELTVFATDIDERALALARAGRYPARAALGMDPGLRARYTFDEGEIIRVAGFLREKCVFGRHDLELDRPLPRLDLIVCQQIFQGVAPCKRDELARRLHAGLRHDGVLLALDRSECVPLELFEDVGDGCFRPRPQPRAKRSAFPPGGPSLHEFLAHREQRLELARAALVPWSRLTSEAYEGVRALIRTLGHPLVVCDGELRVLVTSVEAQRLFDVSADDHSLDLPMLAERLPEGRAVVLAARRVLAGHAAEDVVVRVGMRTFLVRVRAAPSAPEVSLTFTDVTSFEAGAARASLQEDRNAALAYLSKRSLKLTDPHSLHQDAFEVLSRNLSGCTAAVVLERVGQQLEIEARASWALGSDPSGTGVGSRLYGFAGLQRLIQAAFIRGRVVSRDLAYVTEPGSIGVGSTPVSSPVSSPTGSHVLASDADVIPTKEHATASPLIGDGGVLGVLVVFRRPGHEEPGDNDFLRAVTGAVGEGLHRYRVHRRLLLELDVTNVTGHSSTLPELGTGLLRALRPFEVDELEIGERLPAAPDCWMSLYASATGQAGRLAAATATPGWLDGVRFETAADGRGEAWLPIRQGAEASHLLLLRGKKLRAPDPEFARGLRRLGELLGEFFEQRSLEQSRPRDTSASQDRAELEALYAALPLVVSFHDDIGALRRINRELASRTAPILALADGADEQWRERALLQRLYDEEVPRWIERTLAMGEPLRDVELRITAGGERRFWLCTFMPLRNERGAVRGVSTVAQDITSLKLAELAQPREHR